MAHEEVGSVDVRRSQKILEVFYLFVGALTLGTDRNVIDRTLPQALPVIGADLGEASNLRHNQFPITCFAVQASAEDDNRTMAFPFAVKVQATASSWKDARLGRADCGAAEHKHSDKKSCTRCRHNLLPNVDDLLNQYLVR